MHVAELLAFLSSKVADAAREHQTHDQPTEKWNVVCGPGRFSELGCVDLGVVRTRASVTRADVSANGTQAGRGSVFSSRTLARNSLQSPISKVLRSDPRSGRLPRNDSCRAHSHPQAGDPQIYHVCASRESSLICEMKDRLRRKQHTSNLLSSRVGMTLMSLATARRAVHAAMEVINEVLGLVSPLNSDSPG